MWFDISKCYTTRSDRENKNKDSGLSVLWLENISKLIKEELKMPVLSMIKEEFKDINNQVLML